MMVLRNRSKGIWIFAAINLFVAAAFAWRWIQGDPRLMIRVAAVAAAALLAVKLLAIVRPAELRLVDGRLSGRAGLGGAFSTARDNVLRLEPLDGGVLLEFKNLADVEVSELFRAMFAQNHKLGGAHLRLPMKAKAEDVERFRAAL
ncbi:MAG TPA: hypothetical protein VF950_24330 [Planctomycetota bacterium]